MEDQGTAKVEILKVGRSGTVPTEDVVAVEEPMEIRLEFFQLGAKQARSISITMRTPGHDHDLAAGFLFTEGIVADASQIASIEHCGPPTGHNGTQNVVGVSLQPDVSVDIGRLMRHFYTSSSCGVCGKASLDALALANEPNPLHDDFVVDSSTIHQLPEILRNAQPVFAQTGGLHAAALFGKGGTLLDLREDVGRHNALDKLIGAALRQGHVPLSNRVLLLSGRASFELLQKALVARIPVVAAVGAPSSLAVALAERYNITLLGFVRDDRFNVYTAPNRIR